jgi:hypothetical protein
VRFARPQLEIVSVVEDRGTHRDAPPREPDQPYIQDHRSQVEGSYALGWVHARPDDVAGAAAGLQNRKTGSIPGRASMPSAVEKTQVGVGCPAAAHNGGAPGSTPGPATTRAKAGTRSSSRCATYLTGSYGKLLPVTGTALAIGGIAVPYPYIARHIGLDRGRRGRRKAILRDRPEHGLAADDEHLRSVSNLRCGPQHVLQLRTPHAARSSRQRAANAPSTARRSTSRVNMDGRFGADRSVSAVDLQGEVQQAVGDLFDATSRGTVGRSRRARARYASE